jgi:hypothetical protein
VTARSWSAQFEDVMEHGTRCGADGVETIAECALKVGEIGHGPSFRSDSPQVRPTIPGTPRRTAGRSVGPRGFEPRTCGLRVRCSAGLS